MKKILPLFLALVLLSGTVPSVRAAYDTAQSAADMLHELGVFSGVGSNADGTVNYALDRAPTRDEATTMLVRLLGKEAEAREGTWDISFTDVADWAKPYVGYAYANGLTKGTSSTTFGGEDKISATQYLTFVLRALGYESGTDFQWDKAWELSDEIGLTHGVYSAANDGDFLRGDIAIVSAAALSIPRKDSGDLLIRSLVQGGAVDEDTAAMQGLDIYGVTDRVHFIYDIRTFTLFAFMNYTGFNDNNGYPITGVRKAIRDDLAAMNIKISSPKYYTEKNVRDALYIKALGQMGEAPDFRYGSAGTGAGKVKLSDLPDKLREFYYAADIPTLYEKYRKESESALNQYKAVLPSITKTVAFFNVQDKVESEFGVEVVLQWAYQRGDGLGTEEPFYGYGVIRTGPSSEVNALNIIHEYCHGFANRAVDANQSKAEALSGYFNRDSNAVKKYGYGTWMENVHESFVRAISTYFTDNIMASTKAAIIEKDVNDGFVMTKYIYDRIPEFETFDGDFNAFVKMLLVEYPNYAS